MEETESVLDEMYAGFPAQYANAAGNPKLYWDDDPRHDKKGELFTPKPSQIVSTVLGDLDTKKLHFVKVPEHHIVIDFDLKGADNEKSLAKNMEAASGFPPTYAEISKSGAGVHLHYIYDGDPSELASLYSEGIEIKVYTGNASLRRKLTKCNNVSVATISSGLPFKEEKPMHSTTTLQSEQGIRNLIAKAMRKEIPNCAGTKPSMDFIEHILSQAHNSDVVYDVSDLMPRIVAFANKSVKNADYCLKVATRLELKGKTTPDELDIPEAFTGEENEDDRIVFFDCEVYPNLFVICWKFDGSPDTSVVRMINPKPHEVDQLRRYKLVGYNNRYYDNHIIWARILGASNEELYKLSQKIIVDKDRNALFGMAYDISYADVLDFGPVEKKTLKKWEIDLGIPHVEMDIPWDQPVPDDKILQVVDYCCNDVNALEAVFHHCHEHFVARQILADLSGLTVNQPTRKHSERIIFGNERNPQKDFVYTDLSEMFPGYIFNEFSKTEKSTYRDEVVGEGGYVYSDPGIYENVALLDVASMHPTSIIELNLFGPYTEKFKELVEARLAVKEGRFEQAKTMLGGKLRVHIEEIEAKIKEALSKSDDPTNPLVIKKIFEKFTKPLADGLKLVINSIYGFTCAMFPNPFKDPRNKDNIVAKRGALFMIELKNALQAMGVKVIHIKTDSVKIPNATPEIIEAIQEFGRDYGYTFKHEATYEKLCLVNDAVYVAKTYDAGASGGPEGNVGNSNNFDGYWTATGKEFKHPIVFKSLFSHEPITYRDLGETKQVKKGAMYLRYPEGDIKLASRNKEEAIGLEDTHIGRSGLFIPIDKDQDKFPGGKLVCHRDDLGKDSAVPGSSGYLWAEAETLSKIRPDLVKDVEFVNLEEMLEGKPDTLAELIDVNYYTQLVEDAYQSIMKYGDAEEFCR